MKGRALSFSGGLILLVACVAAGAKRQWPAQQSVAANDPRVERCWEVLQKLKDAYVRENMLWFMRYVSDEFLRGKQIFREGVEEDMRKNDVVLLDIWRERATGSGTDRFIDVRWERRFDDRETGRRITQRGRSSLWFREEDGSYKLHDIRGDLMFGFSWSEMRLQPDLVGVITQVNVITDVIVDVEVRNESEVDAPNVVVRVLLNGQQFAPDQRIFMGARDVQVLSFTNTGAPGSGTATVIVDPGGRITEVDEVNNRQDVPY